MTLASLDFRKGADYEDFSFGKSLVRQIQSSVFRLTVCWSPLVTARNPWSRRRSVRRVMAAATFVRDSVPFGATDASAHDDPMGGVQ